MTKAFLSALTRRDFLKRNTTTLGMMSAGFAPLRLLTPGDTSHESNGDVLSDEPLVDVDFAALLSRSDLWYLSPAADSLEGHPIGNGRMGTMVWTTPSTLQFQINRVDVFAVNRNHMGWWQYVKGVPPAPTGPPETRDFMGACAKLTIDVGGTPFAAGEHFQQHLSMYGAESTIQGNGVQARCFVSAVSDVMVVEIDDRRALSAQQQTPVRVTLSLWGKPVDQMGAHRMAFTFVETGKTHGVTRTFTEKDYYCASAVAVQAGQGQLTLATTSETEHTYQITPTPQGKTVILVSSAATMNAKVDVVAQAMKSLQAAAGRSYEVLQKPHRAWWSSFWKRTFVHLSSPDGWADYLERLRTIHLYIMASSSRGKLPPKWNGMIFTTEEDYRNWGSQYWSWTMETLYHPLLASDASDLSYPYFHMYVASLPQYRIAAKQRFNAKGAFIQEVASFDGTPTLPDDVAPHYRALVTGEKTTATLTDRDRSFGKYDHWLMLFAADIIMSPCGETSISQQFTGGATIAINAWFRYRYTGDTQWLRTHAYPLLRDLTEFYHSIAVKKADGLYHMVRTRSHESFGGIDNGLADIAALRGMIPLAIRASEILGVDADLRAQWREFLANLVPLPMGSDPGAKALPGAVLADDAWAGAHLGECKEERIQREESVWLDPIFPFENYTLSSTDAKMARTAHRTMDLAPQLYGAFDRNFYGAMVGSTAVRLPIALARLGRRQDVPDVFAAYYAWFPSKPNGFSMFEGEQAHSIEHMGVMTMALQECLMQSVSPSPGEPEEIWICPALPKTWTTTFSLVARGGFLVTATAKDGAVAFVEIHSRRGEECRIHSPWQTPCFLAEVGKTKHQQTESLIRFPTQAGHTYRLFPTELPVPIRIAPTQAAAPTTLEYTLANGNQVKGILGRKR